MAQPTDAKRDRIPSIAVALESGTDLESAPRITATGKGAFADQLIELALANGVKVREDADLAQILAAFDLDSIIPAEVLEAVAEILAYVYRANADLSKTLANPEPEA